MNNLADQQALARLLKSLSGEPQTLEELWYAQHLFWQDLGWEQSQLQLWLYCQPGLARSTDSSGLEHFGQAGADVQSEPDLAEEIARVVQSHGKPLPLAQLKKRLPAGLLATDPMLKAAINDHPHLQMLGPMVKLT